MSYATNIKGEAIIGGNKLNNHHRTKCQKDM